MSRKKLFLSSVLVFLLFFIIGSNVCYADLVPCGKSGGSPCTICHLIRGVQNLVNYGKNIVVTVAIVGIVIAGLIYMMSSGSESMITLAKSCFKASIMGFAITIAAWLVINITLTLIAAKTNLGIGVSGWFYFTCDTSSSATTSTTSSGTTASTKTSKEIAEGQAECEKECASKTGDELTTCNSNCAKEAAEASKSTGTSTTDSETRDKLKAAGFNVTSTGNCTDKNDSSCTSFDGMDSSAADKIIAVKEKCGISTISGGSETGHSGHKDGLTFDTKASASQAQCVSDNRSSLGIDQICTDGSISNYSCGTYKEKSGVLHISFN